jgi:hypothetical protein
MSNKNKVDLIDFTKFEEVYDTHMDKAAGASAWMRDLETGGWSLISVNDDDPYELVSHVVSASVYNEGLLVAHGWAAPLPDVDDGVAPSKHPERRRVRLMVHVCNEVITCAARIAGEPLIVANKPSGALYEAIKVQLENDKIGVTK